MTGDAEDGHGVCVAERGRELRGHLPEVGVGDRVRLGPRRASGRCGALGSIQTNRRRGGGPAVSSERRSSPAVEGERITLFRLNTGAEEVSRAGFVAEATGGGLACCPCEAEAWGLRVEGISREGSVDADPGLLVCGCLSGIDRGHRLGSGRRAEPPQDRNECRHGILDAEAESEGQLGNSCGGAESVSRRPPGSKRSTPEESTRRAGRCRRRCRLGDREGAQGGFGAAGDRLGVGPARRVQIAAGAKRIGSTQRGAGSGPLVRRIAGGGGRAPAVEGGGLRRAGSQRAEVGGLRQTTTRLGASAAGAVGDDGRVGSLGQDGRQRTGKARSARRKKRRAPGRGG